jgi:hypothetical protein
MDQHTFNTKSWHFFFYRWSLPGLDRKWIAMGHTDFCSYMKRVLFGMLLVAAALALVVSDLWIMAKAIIFDYRLLNPVPGTVASKFSDMPGLEFGGNLSLAILLFIGLVIFLVVYKDPIDRILSFLVVLPLEKAVVAGIDGYKAIQRRRGLNPKVEKEPGFVTMMYRTLKEKTCFRIEFVGEPSPYGSYPRIPADEFDDEGPLWKGDAVLDEYKDDEDDKPRP